MAHHSVYLYPGVSLVFMGIPPSKRGKDRRSKEIGDSVSKDRLPAESISI